MGLISKTVKVKWHPKTKKHYEELGYIYTKMGDEFKVKVEDLTNGSGIKILYQCDSCKDNFECQFDSFNRRIIKSKETYCQKCFVRLFGTKKSNKTKLKNSKSFAQKLIEEYGDNALELYWDYDKNTVDPWEISYGSHKKVWIICQEKDYHGSYEIECKNFINGRRCPYCNGKKIHILDSLGQYIIDNYGEEFLWKIWSDKNNTSPFEVAPNSNKKYWWDCPDDKHEGYERSCNESYGANFRCPMCTNERKESIIEEKTRLYLEELGYEVRTEYRCSLIPINPKTSRPLPFDNEIILSNNKHLIIEVHGKQHYNIDLHKINSTKEESEIKLHNRKLYDRYKRIKCKQAGYEYLEIPYTAFRQKSEKYKKLIDNKIKEILNKSSDEIE